MTKGSELVKSYHVSNVRETIDGDDRKTLVGRT